MIAANLFTSKARSAAPGDAPNYSPPLHRWLNLRIKWSVGTKSDFSRKVKHFEDLTFLAFSKFCVIHSCRLAASLSSNLLASPSLAPMAVFCEWGGVMISQLKLTQGPTISQKNDRRLQFGGPVLWRRNLCQELHSPISSMKPVVSRVWNCLLQFPWWNQWFHNPARIAIA